MNNGKNFKKFCIKMFIYQEYGTMNDNMQWDGMIRFNFQFKENRLQFVNSNVRANAKYQLSNHK